MFQSAINVSEGRSEELFRIVTDSLQSLPGAVLANLSMDPDHNRMVVSLLGSGSGLREGILRLFELAETHIDLSRHEGVHPRIGAVDVVPFVPLGQTPMQAAVELADLTAQQVAERFQIPVLLYEHSARYPERKNLPDLRKKGLAERLQLLPPDYGPSQLHPRLGATVVGARGPLVAFNVVLQSQDLALAKGIAKFLRGLTGVRSLGFWLESQQRVQVSVNLTEPDRVDLDQIYDAIQEQASIVGVEIHSSELIGLAPADSFVKMARHRLKMKELQPEQILEWNALHRMEF